MGTRLLTAVLVGTPLVPSWLDGADGGTFLLLLLTRVLGQKPAAADSTALPVRRISRPFQVRGIRNASPAPATISRDSLLLAAATGPALDEPSQGTFPHLPAARDKPPSAWRLSECRRAARRFPGRRAKREACLRLCVRWTWSLWRAPDHRDIRGPG